jgi:hypothetical protein
LVPQKKDHIKISLSHIYSHIYECNFVCGSLLNILFVLIIAAMSCAHSLHFNF